jgi:hypothetical protein
MKDGMTLHEMATALQATKESKADYVGSTEKLFMNGEGQVEIDGVDGAFDLTNHAERQITSWAKVPATYADRCPKDLLANNVNHWFRDGIDGKGAPARMIRTLAANPYLNIDHQKIRAFVSEKYRVMDNHDVLEAVFPVLEEHKEKGNLVLDSVNVTERKFYIKAHLEGQDELILRPEHEMGKGHDRYFRVRPAIEISNSEIGQGGYNVVPAFYDDGCTNLAVMRTLAAKRMHVGSAQSDGDLWKMLSDETQKITNEALMLQMADFARTALDHSSETFLDVCNLLREKIGMEVKRPEATMKLVAEQFGFNQDETQGVLGALLDRGDLSVFGLQAAVTQFAQEDAVTYDRSSELEIIGGDIIELPAQNWQRILTQAEEMKVAA